MSINTLHKGDDDNDDDDNMNIGHEGVKELWSQGVHTDRQVTGNRGDVIITSKK